MAAVRLIRTSRPSTALGVPTLQSVPATVRVRFTCMACGFGSEGGQLVGDVEKKPMAVTKVATLVGALAAPTQISKRVDLASLTMLLRSIMLRKFKVVTRPRPWSLIIQSQVEKAIMDTRFFTLFGVGGTLLGSILCFLKGVLLVMESYVQYFHALSSHHSDPGEHIMHLLIESLDMFLIGTAMLTFGMGLYVMFIGSRASKGNGLPIPQSNFFGLFSLKGIPSWAGMESISEAKSRIGHAIMLLLQVGVLEKFKSVSLVTGLDLACFAAAIFVSSAGLFILSQLSFGMKT